MASKLLMGDMPELMENILNNLNDEFNSLHSCALVSRHWCKMSIPILWKDPISTKLQPSYIVNYFSSLSEDEAFVLKECLNECGINVEFSKTLFDYARFLKVLNLSRLEDKINEWMNLKLVKPKRYYGSWMNSVFTLLFKSFIENGAILHNLHFYFSDFLEFKQEIFYSLKENVLFFSRLQNLTLDLLPDFDIGNFTALLRILTKNTTKISDLKLIISSFYESRLFYDLFNALIHFIKSQEKLRLFSLIGDEYPIEFYGIISALECQKNSLQEVILKCCGYNAEFEVLQNCKNIKTLRINDCNMELLKILDYNISTLDVCSCPIINVQTIKLILEKSGLLLQRFRFESVYEISEELIVIDALKIFCPNITYLNITDFEFSIQILELIGSLKMLQFLTLGCLLDMPDEELKIQVIQFAELLPLTLQYLDLKDTRLDEFIITLLKHCNTPLKKLIIYNLPDEESDKALIEFCKRKRTLNYVCIFNVVVDDIINEIESYVTLLPYEDIVVKC